MTNFSTVTRVGDRRVGGDERVYRGQLRPHSKGRGPSALKLFVNYRPTYPYAV